MTRSTCEDPRTATAEAEWAPPKTDRALRVMDSMPVSSSRSGIIPVPVICSNSDAARAAIPPVMTAPGGRTSLTKPSSRETPTYPSMSPAASATSTGRASSGTGTALSTTVISCPRHGLARCCGTDQSRAALRNPKVDTFPCFPPQSQRYPSRARNGGFRDAISSRNINF